MTDLAGKSLAEQKDLIKQYTQEELKNDVPHTERVKLLKELLKTVAEARGEALVSKEGTGDKELVEVRLKTEERQTTVDGFPDKVGVYHQESKPVNTKQNVTLLKFISQSIEELAPNPLTHVTNRSSTAHTNVGKTRPQSGGRSVGH
ncbi:hypothetical protein [Candidatus Tisiphia endosymbiont of Nemotelus uliginosus]|uniref:hypothetical protein n=1 Tax=Candidatus Tisiphia endosymbiont of Nemotelus uliginosus TaxID=3077926 RepID=UPI0035C940AE